MPLETLSFRGEVTGLEPTVKAPANPTSELFTSVSNVFGGHDTRRGHGITCLDQDLVTVKARRERRETRPFRSNRWPASVRFTPRGR